MKTLQELYDEVIASEEIKTEFMESAKTDEDVTAFLRKYDCSASAGELKDFLNEKITAETKEMSDEELKQIAGGTGGQKPSKTISEIAITLLAFGGCITQSLYLGSLDDENCLA